MQAWREKAGIIRLSVCRTNLDRNGNWTDGITWDELQRVKNEAGFAHLDAVEIYPAQRDVVNVANMRHLWIYPEPISHAWRETTLSTERSGGTSDAAPGSPIL